MSERYSAEWIQEQVGDRKWLPLRDCSICGVDIGYHVRGTGLTFQSSCGCVRYHEERPASFEEIAKTLEMQKSDEVRDMIMEKLLGTQSEPQD